MKKKEGRGINKSRKKDEGMKDEEMKGIERRKGERGWRNER